MTIATVILPDHVELTELPALAGLPDAALLALQGEIAASRRQPDAVGVPDREESMRDKQFLRLIPQSDGMTKIFGLLDPESAAIVGSAVDELTAPRRGGPRFVDLAEVARSERIARDARSTDQIAVDGLAKGDGAAQLAGQSTAVSLATANRLACGSGYVPVLFDGSQPLDVGRSERLFTNRQRIALAARDGGCILAECERPPAWCKAHHCERWARDEGRTDTALGVLLCRHHHMLVNNNHWEISWEREKYWFVPPFDIDPSQRPVAAQSRGHGAALSSQHQQSAASAGT